MRQADGYSKADFAAPQHFRQPAEETIVANAVARYITGRDSANRVQARGAAAHVSMTGKGLAAATRRSAGLS